MRLLLDRLDQLGRSYNLLSDNEEGFWINFCKKGNYSWKRAEYFEYPKTTLNTCDLCGKTSTPKRVHYRSDIWGWDVPCSKSGRINWKIHEPGSKSCLCTGCWNKVKPLANKQDEIIETQRFINKLNKEQRACRRLQALEN